MIANLSQPKLKYMWMILGGIYYDVHGKSEVWCPDVKSLNKN